MGIGVKYDDGSGSLKPLASYKGMRSPWGSDIHSMHGTKPIRSFGGGKSLIEKLRERREAADPNVAAKDLDKIDPRNGGMTVGDAHFAHPSDADATHRDAKSHEPWARSFMSGIHFEKEAPTGRTIVWGYLRSDRFTGEGRAFETTGETKVPVYSFFEPKDPSPAPFDIATNDDFTKSVVRCIFYWGKDEIELPDYPLDEIPDEGEKTLYLTRTISEGEPVFALTTDEPEEGDEDTAYYKIYDFTDGEVSCDYRTTFLSLGCAGSKFVGDYEGSEEIDGEDGAILVTGHPGNEDAQGHDSHSGLKFLTVGARTDEESGAKIPPKIIARIIDKAEDEDWAAKTMTVTPKEGSAKEIHFLGSDDVDIDLSGGGGGDTVVGSDYIEVSDEKDPEDPTKTNKAVKAKIDTPNVVPHEEDDQHALLTNDTNQNVRSAKTFLGDGQPDSSDRVIIDGLNAKIETKSADGEKTVEIDAATCVETLTNGEKKIVLDPSTIPDECQKKEISVKTLTVTHPRSKNGKTSETYNILGCDDATIDEGDAIDTITSGTPTQSGGFTLTPVTIRLKDGTSLPAFNVSAKNGADGDDGDDGDDAGLKVSATTHQPTQSDTRTGVDVTLTPTINGVDQTPTNFTIYDGKQGVGIGSVSQKSESGKTKTYSVMSDEATPKELGAFTVTDGTDGQDGDDGTPAGFGTPTATATELTPGSTPTATVTATGPDTAKVFAFQFGIPKGKGEQSDWGETDSSADSFIKNKPTIPAEQVNADWNATSGKAQILNKPTSLKNPYSLTIKKNGSSDVVYDGSAAKTITLDPGGVTKIIGSGAVHVSPSSGTGEVTVSSTVRNLVAGSGISLTASGNDITITNTAQGGGGGTTEGFTGSIPFLDGLKYDKSAHCLMYKFGTATVENGLITDYEAGDDETGWTNVPGGDAVEETV